MLKGINKQIIEIKCPESEYFEKILLFVKSEKGEIPLPKMGEEVFEYYSRYVGDDISRQKNKRHAQNSRNFVGTAVVLSVILSGMLGLLSVLLIL